MFVVRVLVVASAWALAHHVGRHLGELTDLGRQRAAEAVGVQRLGWGGERAKHESVYVCHTTACVDHCERR